MTRQTLLNFPSVYHMAKYHWLSLKATSAKVHARDSAGQLLRADALSGLLVVISQALLNYPSVGHMAKYQQLSSKAILAAKLHQSDSS